MGTALSSCIYVLWELYREASPLEEHVSNVWPTWLFTALVVILLLISALASVPIFILWEFQFSLIRETWRTGTFTSTLTRNGYLHADFLVQKLITECLMVYIPWDAVGYYNAQRRALKQVWYNMGHDKLEQQARNEDFRPMRGLRDALMGEEEGDLARSPVGDGSEAGQPQPRKKVKIRSRTRRHTTKEQIEDSYPALPLTRGMSDENLQVELNEVRVNEDADDSIVNV